MKRMCLIAIFILCISCSTSIRTESLDNEFVNSFPVSYYFNESIDSSEDSSKLIGNKYKTLINPSKKDQIATAPVAKLYDLERDGDLTSLAELEELDVDSEISLKDIDEQLDVRRDIASQNAPEFDENEMVDNTKTALNNNLVVENGQIKLRKKGFNIKDSDLDTLLGLKGLKKEAASTKDLNQLIGLNNKQKSKDEEIRPTLLPKGFEDPDQTAKEVEKALAKREKSQRAFYQSRTPASFSKNVGIKPGKDVTEKSYRNKDVIYAAKNAVGETVEYLVRSKGLDINTTDRKGRTALHHAVSMKRIGMVLHLLRIGASKEIKDNTGLTPLDLAMKAGHKKLIKALK